MTVRIEGAERRSVGDKVDHGGVEHVVTSVRVWSDAWGDYAYTEAELSPAGGGDDPGEA